MAKSRANGEGSIRQRKDGYWEARITIGRNPQNGKQQQRSIYARTQRELIAQMKKFQIDLGSGTYVKSSKTTLSDWMERWLSSYVKPTCAASTFSSYHMLIYIHVIPEIGQIELSALTTNILQEFYVHVLAGGRVLTKGKVSSDLSLSTATVHKIRNIMHKALTKAVQERLIRYNPDDGCELPPVRGKERNLLLEEDIPKFLDLLKYGNYYPLFVLELATGLRRGEILGLTWDCINFDNSSVDIKQQLVYLNGKAIVSSVLKTESSRRTLPLDTVIIDVLRKHRGEQSATIGAANKSNLVFCNPSGKPFYPTTVTHYLKTIVKQLGLPNLSFHDLRHSYATYALAHGIDYKTLQVYLGHSNAAFTIQAYPQSTMEMKRRSAEIIGNLLSSKMKPGSLKPGNSDEESRK